MKEAKMKPMEELAHPMTGVLTPRMAPGALAALLSVVAAAWRKLKELA
jgi:hypothetical protein